MKTRFFSVFSGLFMLCLFLLWGCQGNRPLSPNRMANLSFSVPISNEVKASLLGSTSNEILYRVTGPGMSPVGGITYPFSASVSTGSIDFSVNVPVGINGVLALQLNDATTHQSLAVGATALNLSGSTPVTDVNVDLGSLTADCNTTSLLVAGASFSYGFGSDIITGPNQPSIGLPYDITCAAQGGTTYDLTDAQTGSTPSIAYMGGGDLVNYAYVPTDDHFWTDSVGSKNYAQTLQAPAAVTPTPTPSICVTCGGSLSTGQVVASGNPYVEVGDVYCLKLGSIPGGHAWIQVTSLAVSLVTGGFGGPAFCFRTNSTLPYYGFENTPANQSVTSVCRTSTY